MSGIYIPLSAPWIPKGASQYGVTLGASTALTVPFAANVAWIQAEVQDVRWRDDGVPTASVGHVLKAGQTLEYDGDLAALRLIEAVSGGLVNVSYYIK